MQRQHSKDRACEGYVERVVTDGRDGRHTLIGRYAELGSRDSSTGGYWL